MRHRRSKPASVAALLAVVAVASVLAQGRLRSAAQPEDVGVEQLFNTPPIAQLPPDTSVSLSRVTLQPGGSRNVRGAGPVVYYVETGSLALREPRDDSPQVLMYSGPAGTPPPLGSDGRDAVLPPGYAVLVEDGVLGPIRNPGDGPLVLLALGFVPEHLEQGESTTARATAVPAGSSSGG